jgi:hypothetical protein
MTGETRSDQLYTIYLHNSVCYIIYSIWLYKEIVHTNICVREQARCNCLNYISAENSLSLLRSTDS